MSQQEIVTLYSYCNNNVILKEAINYCHPNLEGAIALLYSRHACQILCLKSNCLYNCNDEPVNNLSEVFEARIFTEGNELRWLNHNLGNGKAVLLSESEQSINHFMLQKQKTYEVLPQQYLLWGKKAKHPKSTANWQSLSEARIGQLDIPMNQTLQDEERVYLKTREYMAQADNNYGNYAVMEERLVKLEAQ